MVSSSFDMALQDLLDALERLRRDLGDTPEYRENRQELPDDWPM
jgi:hypothetical protein